MPDQALTVIEPAAPIVPADNPAIAYLASLPSANSRRAMLNALNLIVDVVQPGRFSKPAKTTDKGQIEAYKARFLSVAWGELRSAQTDAIRARLIDTGHKPATINHAISALRGVLNKACDLGYMTDEECRRACKLKPVKGESPLAGREVAIDEVKLLVQACKADKSPAGARDAAIIGIMWACGLRRAELAALDVADYTPGNGRLEVRSGKGRKARTVYVKNGAKTALDAWLVTRGTSAGALFNPINKAGRMDTDHGMTTQAVYNILTKRAGEAHIDQRFSPHDFRRTFVSEMLERGADIATVAKLAGHANITTTARYDRRTEETKEKAAGLLHFPF